MCESLRGLPRPRRSRTPRGALLTGLRSTARAARRASISAFSRHYIKCAIYSYNALVTHAPFSFLEGGENEALEGKVSALNTRHESWRSADAGHCGHCKVGAVCSVLEPGWAQIVLLQEAPLCEYRRPARRGRSQRSPESARESEAGRRAGEGGGWPRRRRAAHRLSRGGGGRFCRSGHVQL